MGVPWAGPDSSIGAPGGWPVKAEADALAGVGLDVNHLLLNPYCLPPDSRQPSASAGPALNHALMHCELELRTAQPRPTAHVSRTSLRTDTHFEFI